MRTSFRNGKVLHRTENGGDEGNDDRLRDSVPVLDVERVEGTIEEGDLNLPRIVGIDHPGRISDKYSAGRITASGADEDNVARRWSKGKPGTDHLRGVGHDGESHRAGGIIQEEGG